MTSYNPQLWQALLEYRARSVSQCFEDLLTNSINIPDGIRTTASVSQQNLRKFLQDECERDEGFPPVLKVADRDFLGGSFARHTKVRPLDDIDVYLPLDGANLFYYMHGNVLPYTVRTDGLARNPLLTPRWANGRWVSSSKLVEGFASVLEGRFPRTKIRPSGQAVTVQMTLGSSGTSDGLGYDVVPCFSLAPHQESELGFYLIPDGRGAWIRTNPRYDAAIADLLQGEHNRLFRKVVKILKYWNAEELGNKLGSYFVELAIARALWDKGIKGEPRVHHRSSRARCWRAIDFSWGQLRIRPVPRGRTKKPGESHQPWRSGEAYSGASFRIDMNLVAAMRGEYRRSESLLWRGIYTKVAIYAATLLNAIWSNEVAAATFLIVACAGQGLVLLLRSAASAHVELGERLRRLAMLQDGVGREVPPLEAAALAEKIWTTPAGAVATPYYASQFPRSAQRLIDITAECAFYSGSIANAAWRTFLGVSVGASSALVLSLILATAIGTVHTRLEVLAKAALIGITFWMTEDFLDMAVRYRGLGASCDRVLRECSRLLEQENPSLGDAYFVLQEYDSAFANTPPLPSSIYSRRNERLAEIWRETHPRTTAAQCSPP